MITLEYGFNALSQGTLFVVATPIGNRDDLSPRARQTLLDADLIAAEDTRHTGRLLSSFGIKTPQIALHDHNEDVATEKVIIQLKNGNSVALVSDAGTPLVSDPGFRLLRRAHAENIAVSPIPGPSALLAALSVAGIPTDRWCFEGFLPQKKSLRSKRLDALSRETRSCVLFVSVHRIEETIAELVATCGADRAAFLGRELSKLHEQCISGDLALLAKMLAVGDITKKGEFVLVVAGAEAGANEEVTLQSAEVLLALAAVLPPKEAAATTARLTGLSRNDLYRRLIEDGNAET